MLFSLCQLNFADSPIKTPIIDMYNHLFSIVAMFIITSGHNQGIQMEFSLSC